MKILFGVTIKVHKEIAEAEVEAFKKSGVEVTCSYFGNSGYVKDFFGRFFLILKNAINLNIKAKKSKVEIVYLNTAFDHKTLVRDAITLAIIKGFNRKIKIILKLHGSIESVIFSRNFLKNYILRNTDLLLLLSVEEFDAFLKAGVDKNKLKITANAINKTLYQPDCYFRDTFNLKNGTLTLLFIGRLIQQKGILDLIEACKLLKEKKLDFRLFCLGDGPLLGKIKEMITALDLQSEIILKGHIPEVETKYFYSNCDLLILPTYREGFSMAIFQAIAAGKPIITTKVNASADYLTEFENCLWIKRNNPKDVSEKIMCLAENKEMRSKMSANNLMLADNFTAEKIVEKLNIHFKSLLQDQKN